MILTILRAAILISILSCLFSSFSNAGSDKSYSISKLLFLEDAAINAKNHEVIKIPGQISNNIVYIPTNKTFIVSSSLITKPWLNLWRINADGAVVDTYTPTGEYENEIPSSGIWFRGDNYVDWIFSGDKAPKPFSQKINVSDLSVDDIRLSLSLAKQIVWTENREYETIYRGLKTTIEFRYFLRSDTGWSLLISPTELDTTQYPELHSALNNIHTTDYHGPELPIKFLAGEALDVTALHSPIRLLDFKKIGSSRSRLMDINNSAWVGKYGHGHFELKVGNDNIHFKSFHKILKDSYRDNGHRTDMQYVDATTLTSINNDLAFLVLATSRAPSRKRSETGTYIIRQKPSQKPTAKLSTQEFNFVQNSTKKSQINFSMHGFDHNSAELYGITYYNFESESLSSGEPLDRNTATRSMPMEIYTNFSLPVTAKTKGDRKSKKKGDKNNKHYSYSLKINDEYYAWRDVSSISYSLHFDYDEILNAYSALSSSTSVLTLAIAADFVDKGVELTVTLSNSTNNIQLKNIRFSSIGGMRENKEDTLKIFNKNVIHGLKVINKQTDTTENNPSAILPALNTIRKIVEESEHPSQLNGAVQHATWFLLNHAIASKDNALKHAVVRTYAVHIFPKSGVSPGLVDLIGRLITTAVASNNTELMDDINTAFFGPDSGIDFEANQWLFDNGILDQSYRLAKRDSRYIANYVQLSKKVFKNHSDIKILAESIANHYTKFILKFIRESKNDVATQLSTTYIETIYPITGHANKSTDLISLSIVLGMRIKNEDFLSSIISDFMPNVNFDEGNNNVLQYNLACYYATHENKEKMLAYIKRSIANGHSSTSFFTDNDFSKYLDDPDFQDSLK